MWARSRAIAPRRTTCDTASTSQISLRLRKRSGSSGTLLTARAQNIANLAIDLGRVAGAGVDHLRPFLAGLIQLRLVQQIAGLHDGLDGVGEVMRQGAQLFADLSGNLYRLLGLWLRHVDVSGLGSPRLLCEYSSGFCHCSCCL